MATATFPIAEDKGDPTANPARPAVTCQSLLSDGKTYCSNLARWRLEKDEVSVGGGGSSKWTWFYCDPHVKIVLGTGPSVAAPQAIPEPPAAAPTASNPAPVTSQPPPPSGSNPSTDSTSPAPSNPPAGQPPPPPSVPTSTPPPTG